MTTKEHIELLKELQTTARSEGAFRKHESVLAWIDTVAPLLKYDDEHYELFMDAALKVSIPNISSHTAIPCLNIMKSVVNRAIIELENDITSPQAPKQEALKYPDKMTLKWIWDHVPANYYWSFLLILVFVFSLGITFSKTNLYKSLTDVAAAITKSGKTIEKTRP
jgi:hypothetical protein